MCLVHYPERIKVFTQRYGSEAMNEMFKPEHYKEVDNFFRFTTNLRNVNTKTEAYYFPLSDAKGSRYYSSVDFRDAFFTVELAEEDRDKTAFTTPYGRFKWQVLPRGMVKSSRLYSKVTLEAFQHIPKTKLINYIDDTMVHNGTFLDHLDTLQEIYDIMNTKKMVCKIEKSYLGYD